MIFYRGCSYHWVTPFWWFSCSLLLSVSHKPVFHITTSYCNLNNPVIIFQFPRIVRRMSIEDALIILVTSFWRLFFSLLLSVYHRPIFSLRISFFGRVCSLLLPVKPFFFSTKITFFWYFVLFKNCLCLTIFNWAYYKLSK